MHITKIVIEGFKSYKNRVIIEPSSGHNVVVGQNGAGKSNSFAAVEFVLSPTYAHLRQEDRKRLLHESAGGQATMSAYVELTFDNQDNRFPDERDVITLKRVIGLKKDEFLLNSKQLQKSQVDSLLESAGFSRSNPYNIVKQGKVAALIKMSAHHRLDLFKEIAGTRVYDQRRSDSMRILRETEHNVNQIEEITDQLDERISELEEERKELVAYQKFDTERRGLEYRILKHENNRVKNQLYELEKEHQEAEREDEEAHTRAAEAQEALIDHEEALRMAQHELDAAERQNKEMVQEAEEQAAVRAELEVELEEAKKNLTRVNHERVEADEELTMCKEKVEEEKESLKNLERELDKVQQQVEEKEKDARRFVRERDAASARISRSHQYRSKNERDRKLRQMIEREKKVLKQEKKRESEAKEAEIEFQKEMEQERKDLKRLEENELPEIKRQTKALDKRVDTLQNKLHEASYQQQEEWRKQNEIRNTIGRLNEALSSSQRSLNQLMPRSIRTGYNRLEREEGVEGMLGELITMEDNFCTCVEAAAGNALFHVVVRDARTAQHLSDILDATKSGRVTFMPLDRLADRDRDVMQSDRHPDLTATGDIVPLMEKLNYAPQHEVAVKQVFGRVVIARNLEIGQMYAREKKCTAVTLDGDLCNSSGALTGGYRRSKSFAHSRIVALTHRRKAVSDLERAEVDQKQIEKDIEKLEQKKTQFQNEMYRVEMEQRRLTERNQEVERRSTEVHRLQTDYGARQREVCERARSHAATVDEIEQRIQQLEQEIASPFDPSHVAEAEAQLEALEEQAREAEEAADHVKKQNEQIVDQVETHRAQLKEKWYKRLDQAKERLNSANPREAESRVRQMEDKLIELESRLGKVGDAMDVDDGNDSDIVVTKARETYEKLVAAVEKQKEQGEKATKLAETRANLASKRLQQRSVLLQRRDECTRSIRQLGAVPSEVLEEDDDHDAVVEDVLLKELEKCHEKLRKYAHVNKKAVEQLGSFEERRQRLAGRADQLKGEENSIRELIEHLDIQKEAAIERTFRGIAHHFKKVFSELVPGGRAELVMETRQDQEQSKNREEEEEEDREEQEKLQIAIDRYTGVALRVAFAGSHDVLAMQQLSGGQQTVVALSLIFAIQRCDPFPFYLFDEIDSNLDTVYREAVAQLIASQAAEHEEGDERVRTQFICTTFRPELVRVADECFCVQYDQKVSRVSPVSREQALEVLEMEERNEGDKE